MIYSYSIFIKQPVELIICMYLFLNINSHVSDPGFVVLLSLFSVQHSHYSFPYSHNALDEQSDVQNFEINLKASVTYIRESRKFRRGQGEGGPKFRQRFFVVSHQLNLFYRDEKGSVTIFLGKPIPSRQKGLPSTASKCH